jgi:hypothetical protein
MVPLQYKTYQPVQRHLLTHVVFRLCDPCIYLACALCLKQKRSSFLAWALSMILLSRQTQAHTYNPSATVACDLPHGLLTSLPQTHGTSHVHLSITHSVSVLLLRHDSSQNDAA